MSHPVHDRFARARGPAVAPVRNVGVVALAAIAAIVGAIQLAAPEPAAAVAGLQRTFSHSQLTGPEPVKQATAECPNGKHVIGGGAVVHDGGRKLVRLTWLIPWTPPTPGDPRKDGYYVTAEAPNLSSNYNWYVTAFAVCADKGDTLSGYTIKQDWTDVSSSGGPFAQTSARCRSGTVAYGTGAAIFTSGADPSGQGQIGLQLTRTSGPLDISRATARESASGYGAAWQLVSYAVCAERRGQIHAEGTIAPAATATDACDSGRTHGPGGGGGLTDGGPVWLQEIYPFPTLNAVRVDLTGPLYPSIGGMVAHQTCAQ